MVLETQLDDLQCLPMTLTPSGWTHMHHMLSKLSGVAPIKIRSVEQEWMLSMLAEGIPDDHDLQGGSTITWRLLPIHMHFLYTKSGPTPLSSEPVMFASTSAAIASHADLQTGT